MKAIEDLNYVVLNGRPLRVVPSQRDPSTRRSGVGNTFIKVGQLEPTPRPGAGSAAVWAGSSSLIVTWTRPRARPQASQSVGTCCASGGLQRLTWRPGWLCNRAGGHVAWARTAALALIKPSELACWTPAGKNLPASDDSLAGASMHNSNTALQSRGACSGHSAARPPDGRAECGRE